LVIPDRPLPVPCSGPDSPAGFLGPCRPCRASSSSLRRSIFPLIRSSRGGIYGVIVGNFVPGCAPSTPGGRRVSLAPCSQLGLRHQSAPRYRLTYPPSAYRLSGGVFSTVSAGIFPGAVHSDGTPRVVAPPEPAHRSLVLSLQPERLPPIRVMIPDAGRGRAAARGELQPGALGPVSRLRRRYAPAGAPPCAPPAPVGPRRWAPGSLHLYQCRVADNTAT
jgi:hypothetical protein